MRLNLERHALTLLLPLLLLCSCGATSPKDQAQAPTAMPGGTPATQNIAGSPQQQQQDAFAKWVVDFKHEALDKGISQSVLDDAFADVKAPVVDVVSHDHTQPEQTKTFKEYLSGFLKQRKIDAGREQWDSHAQLLADVQQQYGVPIPIMLSLWEVESNFGKLQGRFSIVNSLTTLAYDGRRSAFFRKQLLDALTILQQDHMKSAELTGSWAGAMGQVQFMPTSFLSFAVDFDGDGKRDIWKSDGDAVASMANYLHTRGWDPDSGWGIHVRLPRHGFTQAWVDSKERHSLKQWQKLGLRTANGGHLPKKSIQARLVVPDNDISHAYLVYPNYDVIMDWNHSIYFATSVCLLADAIEKQ